MSDEFFDEIESIEYLGEQDTIDINVSGNRLFYANDILTHNSAVEEIEFDHSHISGGLSKIQTADNVIGIFTSRAMKERGRYQIQFMKTRNSSGVGHKVDLEFNADSLRVTDLGLESQDNPQPSIYQSLKKNSVVNDILPNKKPAEDGVPKLRKLINSNMISNINPELDDF